MNLYNNLKFVKTLSIAIFIFATINAASLNAACIDDLTNQLFFDDFGASSAIPAGELSAGTTTYCYEDLAGSCPDVSSIYNSPVDIDDGQYSIMNNPTTGFSSSPGVFKSMSDHTPGDTDGNMMVINASFATGEMYRAENITVSPLTVVRFSSWLANINGQPAQDYCNNNEGGLILPNVNFIIYDAVTGTILQQQTSGDVPATSDSGNQWSEYGYDFVIPEGVTSVTVSIVNNAPGGCGNDLALDDVRLVTQICEADLGVSKTDNKITYTPGGLFSYTVVVNNNGPDDAYKAIFEDVLPTWGENVTWDCSANGGAVCPNVSGSGNVINETINYLPNGSSVTYTISGVYSTDMNLYL